MPFSATSFLSKNEKRLFRNTDLCLNSKTEKQKLRTAGKAGKLCEMWDNGSVSPYLIFLENGQKSSHHILEAQLQI